MYLMRVRIIVLLLLGTAPLAHSAEVKDEELRFSFIAPEGFHEVKQMEIPQAKHKYSNFETCSQGNTILISIDSIGGVLRQESTQHLLSDLETEQGFPIVWKNLSLHVDRVTDDDSENPLITYHLLLPLDPEAIFVRILGPRSNEPEMKALFTELVASIEGASSWRASR